MTYQPTQAIEVLCWNQRVGVLAPHPQRDLIVFEYYPEFLNSGIELAPLTLPLSKKTPAAFPYLPFETFQHLPAFIADSLPDSFGNNLITSWMETHGMAKNEITVLDRLAYMGSRGMGALEFRPEAAVQKNGPSALEMKSLVEVARRAFTLEKIDLETDPDEALMQLIQVGTSAGGAKAKAVIGYNPETGSVISGQFDLPFGYQHWLVKINTSEDAKRDYGRIEYAYYLMAKACGITISDSSMLEVAGRMHFMTRRFDRVEENQKIHLQTLCAMNELDYNQRATHDYVQFFQTAQDLELETHAIDEIFDRMVFNVCAANNDDHTKNQSFLLKERGTWELAPAYDLMHAFMPGNKWIEQHLMGVGGKFREIERSDLVRLGQRFNVASPEARVDLIAEQVMNWPTFAKESGLSGEETERVRKDIELCCKPVLK